MAKDSRAITGQQPGQPTRRRQPISIGQWFRETRAELSKVTWPTPEQTRSLTLVVIAVCVIIAAFLGVVDALLGKLVQTILGIK